MIMTQKITDEPGSGERAKGHQMMPFIAHCVKCYQQLAENFSNHARANGTATFTDCETQTVVHRDWVDQVTTILMLSPGITISTPSGSSMVPVTSVVRK